VTNAKISQNQITDVWCRFCIMLEQTVQYMHTFSYINVTITSSENVILPDSVK